MVDFNLKDISSFVQVARAGSISAAAKNTNTPKATISHQVRRLEDVLGIDLFVRLPRKLELTDEGSRYLAHCHSILASVENAAEDIKTSHSKLKGRLSVGVAAEFGTSAVGPVLEEFADSHPELNFDVEILSDYQAYFDNPDIDCLIYTGEPPDTSLIGRRIAEFKFGLYAGVGYLKLNGYPKSIDNISGHQCIQYLHNFQSRAVQTWDLKNKNKNVSLSPSGRMRSANYWMVKYFTVANLGIAYLPDFFVESERKMDLVKVVLPSWKSEIVPVYALYPKHRHGSKKVSIFIDLWQQKIKDIKHTVPYGASKREIINIHYPKLPS